MSNTASKKSAFIISNFRDAGTGERFTAGSTTSIEEGAFKNYEAAGLVRAPSAEDRSAAKTDERAKA